MRLKTATLALLFATGCGAATSDFMKPAGSPKPPSPNKAVVIFAADVTENVGQSTVLTVWDENRRFHGQLFEHSMFQTELPPGRHAFALVDIWRLSRFIQPGAKFPCNTLSTEYPHALTADLAAGKTYIVWVRWEHLEGAVGNIHIIPVRPDAKTLNPADVFGMWRSTGKGEGAVDGKKPFFAADLARGQAYLDQNAEHLCTPGERAPPNVEPDLPASFGFDSIPAH